MTRELAKMLEYWADTIRRGASATTPAEMADAIIAAGYVKLAEDQTAPKWELVVYGSELEYARSVESDMRAAGFRKVV